jgi:hypothetical protein
MKTHLLKLKTDLKALATEIRSLKSKRKELRGYVPGLENAQEAFRSGHIAYCILRGKTLEQIEPKLRHPDSWHHARVRKEANRIVQSILEVENAAPKS